MNTRLLVSLSLSLSLGLLGCADEKDAGVTTPTSEENGLSGPGGGLPGGNDTGEVDTTDTGETTETTGTTETTETTDTTDETTDGSVGDQGPDDWYADRACELFGEASEVVTAASSESDAAQALITPSEDTIYEIQRASDGDAYITLEVPDWHVELRAFANPGTTYEIFETGGAGSLMLNGSCPDEGISDQVWTIHDWGSYTIRFDASSPDPIYFAVMEEG